MAALGEGFAASGVFVSVAGLDKLGDDGALGLLIEPKPLNSGTPSIADLSPAILLGDRGEEGVTGRGDPACAVVLLGVSALGCCNPRNADTGVCGCC